MKPIRLVSSFKAKATSCVFLTLCADVLLYGHAPGWTLGAFGIVLLAATVLHTPSVASWRAKRGLSLVLLGLACSMILQPNPLNMALYTTFIVAFVLLSRDLLPTTSVARIKTILKYTGCGWLRFLKDSRPLLKSSKRSTSNLRGNLLHHYLLPIVLTVIFLALFAQANPIIDNWLSRIEWRYVEELLSFTRIAFWFCVAAACWSVLRPRMKRPVVQPTAAWQFSWLAPVLNPTSILYSLLAFNGLFLVQNLLDLSVLVTGDVLPAGVTYAQYAHQGAYPLIATALLAAAFVLIALRPGSSSESVPLIRNLVYFWIGQNILLVCFCVSRLYHYVGEYSLTYLRLSAFIWMGLVAFGLALIVARLYWQKSGEWLIRSNLGAVVAVLYVCSFIPMGSIIAYFNVRHCQEITKEGNLLDLNYLDQIGPEALPALTWYLNQAPSNAAQYYAATAVSVRLKAELASYNASWHSWTPRRAWLEHKLGSFETPSTPITPNSSWQVEGY